MIRSGLFARPGAPARADRSAAAARWIGRAGSLLAGLLIAGGTAPAAQAGESAPVALQGAQVRLMSGTTTGATVSAGLEIRLAPHWKTYWRYPGDAGVPLVLSWKGSHNVAGVTMDWPAPRRFSDGAGVTSIGYKGTVLFPLAVTLADPKAPARLHLMVDFAVCEALCLPAQAEFSLVLDGKDDAEADALIAKARASVPAPAALGGDQAPAITAVNVDRAQSPPELVVEARVSNPMADLFVEGPTPRWALPLPKKTALPGGAARFTIPLDGAPAGASFEGARLTLTLVDPPKAISVSDVVKGP